MAKSSSESRTNPAAKRVPLLMAELDRLYPDPRTELDYKTPLQLMVAVMLSAQCTDKRVNMVTPALFARFPTAKAFASADLLEIEELIKTTGFFHNKAKNILAACKVLEKEYGGEVPNTLEKLVALPGLGRKSANCVLGDAFGIPGITVDTHVGRLSRRLGLSEEENPVKVEQDLMAVIPQPQWTRVSHQLILHGRRVCDSRKPNCDECTLSPNCPRTGVEPREKSKTAVRKKKS